MRRFSLLFLVALLLLPAALTSDQVSQVRVLNAAYKQTGVYITRLRSVPVAKHTPYQRSRLAYWLSKRAEYRSRIATIKAQAPLEPLPPATYVGGASCWDAPCYMPQNDPFNFSSSLGTSTVWWGLNAPQKAPVFVLVPGGPLPPGGSNIAGLEWRIADRGGVAFRADYRSQRQYEGGSPMAFEDVSCAVAAARALAPRYGGDPSRITLVAHSFGGFISLQTLSKDWGVGPNCLFGGDGMAEQYVSFSAITSNDQIGPFFLASDYPDAVVNPHSSVPTLVMWGAADIVARINEFSPLYPATKSLPIPDADHTGVLFDDLGHDWLLR